MASCSNICGSKQAQADIEGGHLRYGVRSYLHQFYEDCTASIWENEDDFQIQRSPNRWSSVLWKDSSQGNTGRSPQPLRGCIPIKSFSTEAWCQPTETVLETSALPGQTVSAGCSELVEKAAAVVSTDEDKTSSLHS